MANVSVLSGVELGLSDRIGAFLRNLQDARGRYRVYRQTVRELNALTDRDLSDLGINRTMIDSIAVEAAYGK
ncbi:DUF1127 domain-containing protein [Albidovulum sp.]|nr:DUF1127 domain-containing protein [Paracoccaceae bacterium]MCC0047335.1 DUF1127 domain-containing protein [Defluviimonas sp.]HPE26602.1 DUF1127 domain-containing protein [Albidovulum sp.]MCB2123292.1 DUF1127 domain-containing protein [Paracoccaceae bacterium]MCB2132032.1 DUF1127 domain-containing protein [Paracoccaceae bacterium]